MSSACRIRWASALMFMGLTCCAARAQTIAVSVSPHTVAIKANGSNAFAAIVSGAKDASVIWLVNGIRGGAPSIGIISASGVYTAPAHVPSAIQVSVEAASLAATQSTGTAIVSVAPSAIGKTVYYVATNGDNSNLGTASAPWRTIQHAVDSVPAGATIRVRGGLYKELVTLTRSGSATAGLTSIEAVPNELPILDGTGLGVPNGQNGLFTIVDASWIQIEGFEIRNYVSHSAAAVPIGIFIEGAGSHIELRNNHVHNITTTVTTSSGNALGIAVYGSEAPAAISQLIIDGNELDHLTTGFSESLSLSGNVTSWEVTRNSIHDNNNIGINIEGFFKTAPQSAYDLARNGLVAGNSVYNISSKANPAYQGALGADGIYVDGGALVTIQQNVVHDTDIGIELASEVPGRATTNVIARDNLLYRNLTAGLSIGGADASANGGTNNCQMVNNSLVEDDSTKSGSGEFQIQYHASGNVVFNNIMVANSQGLLVNGFAAQTSVPALLDHNLYLSTVGNSDSTWVWRGTSFAGIAAFQKRSGQDAHSRYGNPQFTSVTLPNLHIAKTSPAINLGVNLGLLAEGLVDFAGNPRTVNALIDAGVYEH